MKLDQLNLATGRLHESIRQLNLVGQFLICSTGNRFQNVLRLKLAMPGS